MAITQDETRIFNASLRQVDVTNKQLLALYKQSQKEVEAKLLEFAIAQIKGGKISAFQQERFQLLLIEINKEITRLQAGVRSTISRGHNNNFLRTYYSELFAIEKEINLVLDNPKDFFLNAPILNKEAVIASQSELIAGNTFLDRMGQDRRIMQFRLRDAVGQSIVQGESIKQLKDRLELIDDVYITSANKAMTTARTELLTAYSKGQELATEEAETSGVEFKFAWSSTLDDRTRTTHVIADRKKALIIEDEPVFTVGGVKFSSPRIVSRFNTSGNTAREKINCRCRRLNQPFGIEPTRRVGKKKDGTWVDLNGDVTAEEWRKREYGVTIRNDVKGAKVKVDKRPTKIPDVKPKPKSIPVPETVNLEGKKRKIKSKNSADVEKFVFNNSKYTKGQIKDLALYKNVDYSKINSVLLDPDSFFADRKDIKDKIKNIKSAFKNTVLQKDVVTYRGVISKDMAKNANKFLGEDITGTNFWSTSLDKKTAEKFLGEDMSSNILFKINAKKGIPTINMENFAINTGLDEKELLFSSSQKYKVTKVIKKKGQPTIFELETL